MSDKRKRVAWVAYAAAVWSTLWFVLFVVGAVGHGGRDKAENEAFGYLTFAPALIGAIAGLTTLERRLPNPLFLRIGVYWNALMLSVFLLFGIIGMLR